MFFNIYHQRLSSSQSTKLLMNLNIFINYHHFYKMWKHHNDKKYINYTQKPVIQTYNDLN